MKLNEFLSTLSQTDTRVIIKELLGTTEIASINAGGYASLDDTLEAREIAQWQILNTSSILVLLKAEEEDANEVTG